MKYFFLSSKIPRVNICTITGKKKIQKFKLIELVACSLFSTYDVLEIKCWRKKERKI